MTLRFDLSVVFDIPLDTMLYLQDIRKMVNRAVVLSSPISIIPDAERFCDYPLGDGYDEYDDGIDDFFQRALWALDRHLIEDTGVGILDTYGGKPISSQIHVFERFFYEGERTYRLDYMDTSNNSKMPDFLGAVYRCCINLICKDYGQKGPTIPTILDKNMRTIVSRALYPQEILETVPKHLISSPFTSASDKGLLIIPKEHIYHEVKSTFKHDLDVFVSTPDNGPSEYVPSPYWTPEYRDLDKKQLDFYLHWRTEVRKGNYPTTDLGYVWIYLCELINQQNIPQTIYESILSLGEAYEGSMVRDSDNKFFSIDYDHLIMRTALDYAIVNHLPLPNDQQYPCNLTLNDSIKRMLEGECIRISKDGVIVLANVQKSMRKNINDDVIEIFCRALCDINSLSTNEGGIASVCNIKLSTGQVSVFEGLRYFHYPNNKPAKYEVTFYDFLNNKCFEKESHQLLKFVKDYIKDFCDGRKNIHKELEAFGIVYDGIPGLVSEHFSEKVKRIPRGRKDIKLDPNAVHSAQDDLHRITEMMSTENEGIADLRDIVDESYEKTTGEGWEDFIDSLDSEQVDLLLKMIGNPEDLTIKRIKPSFFDAINDLAMDIIGDVIIDSGKILEDYLDDLKSSLGKRRYLL